MTRTIITGILLAAYWGNFFAMFWHDLITSHNGFALAGLGVMLTMFLFMWEGDD